MARRSLPVVVRLFATLGVLLIPLASAGAASAAPQDITLSPTSTELSAPPGGTTQGKITVINGGSDSFSFKAYADPYHVVGVGYDPQFNLIPGKTDPSSWVHFDAMTTATLAPNQSVDIPYSLKVPMGTAPGGYYAVVFAETQPPAGAQGVTSHSRVGSILYITVQGTVTQAGSIKSLPQSHIIFGTTLPLATEVQNDGGLHFITTAHLNLVNYFTNKTVYSASLQRYVLPQTVRRISTVANTTAAIGLYKVEAKADILGRTETLPSQWVLVIHPVALWGVPVVALLLAIYLYLPKTRPKSKSKRKKKV